MRRKQFSEEQIIGILKDYEAGVVKELGTPNNPGAIDLWRQLDESSGSVTVRCAGSLTRSYAQLGSKR